jgi:hypothetical protein
VHLAQVNKRARHLVFADVRQPFEERRPALVGYRQSRARRFHLLNRFLFGASPRPSGATPSSSSTGNLKI